MSIRRWLTAVAVTSATATATLAAQTPEEVEVSPPQLGIGPGERAQVVATPYSDAGELILSAAVRWTSSDTSVVRVVPDPSTAEVATISGGRTGTAVVEARAGNARGRVTVRVARPGELAESTPRALAPPPADACTGALRLPATGSWVEWRTPKTTVRLSYLGTDGRAVPVTHRFEVTTQSEAGAITLQLVTSTWPNTSAGLEEVVTQVRGRPPVRIGRDQLAQNRRRIPSSPVKVVASRCADLVEVGTERVTVRAGTFAARHFRDAQAGYDAWVSDAVPFGLVKTTSPSGTIELAAQGSGAESGITGQPRPSPRRPIRDRARP